MKMRHAPLKQQRSAGIVVFHEYKDEITFLLLHYVSGHWDFPKGKLEAGENDIQAAQRELFEETGLHATIIPGFEESLAYKFKEHDDGRVNKTVLYFLGKSAKQEVQLSKEHQGFAWLSYEDAIKRVTYTNAREILRKAYDFLIKS